MAWKNGIIQNYAFLLSRIIGLNLTVKGTPPEPPFFLVSNHLSYIDILPFWYTCKCTFIAKSEVRSWPFIGFAASVLGILFIDRERSRDLARVNASISSNITQNQGVILFPEGTSTNGADVRPFNAPLLYYPASEKFPVSFASISYSTSDETKPASEYVCWWGDMTFFSHFFNLLKIKKFDATVIFGDKKVMNENRKKLARTLHQKVAESFAPVVNKDTTYV